MDDLLLNRRRKQNHRGWAFIVAAPSQRISHPPRACISRWGSSRNRSMSISPPARSPTRSNALRSSAPRSRRAAHPDRMMSRMCSGCSFMRSGLRRSTPDLAYKHRYHNPSAVTRLRSHCAQNGVVVDGIIPKIVPSGKQNRWAGAAPRSGSAVIGPYR